MMKLNPLHLKCLLALGKLLEEERGAEEGYYVPFSPVMERTGLTRQDVRRIVRLLKRKGLAEFKSGLWSDDGPAGSGYRPTAQGWKIIDEQKVET